jgi:hypothetical protein
MIAVDDGSGAAGGTNIDSASIYVGQQRTFRVNDDGSTTEIVNVSRQSVKYGVQYTWTILATTWDTDGGPPEIGLKTEEVNAICGHDHVQGFRTEADQGPSNILYHYAVITVGTDDQAVTDETRVRMDMIGLPSAFAAVDATWKRLQDAGA